MNKYFKLYLYAVIILLVSGVLYGGLLPSMVSANDTILVFIGIAGALVWPALVVTFVYRQFKKKFKNA
jgi:hypothetical protein